MSTNSSVQLFPIGYSNPDANLDNVDDVTLYAAININDGSELGKVGVMTPADEQYGYDALWGWMDANAERRAETPFTTLNDAFNDFLKEVAE